MPTNLEIGVGLGSVVYQNSLGGPPPGANLVELEDGSGTILLEDGSGSIELET